MQRRRGKSLAKDLSVSKRFLALLSDRSSGVVLPMPNDLECSAADSRKERNPLLTDLLSCFAALTCSAVHKSCLARRLVAERLLSADSIAMFSVVHCKHRLTAKLALMLLVKMRPCDTEEKNCPAWLDGTVRLKTEEHFVKTAQNALGKCWRPNALGKGSLLNSLILINNGFWTSPGYLSVPVFTDRLLIKLIIEFVR